MAFVTGYLSTNRLEWWSSTVRYSAARMASAPRASTEDESASLLQIPGQQQDDGGEGGGPASRRGSRQSRMSFLSDIDDRRSIKDVITNPRLLTTFEQGLIVITICLACLSAILTGLFLGSFERLRREGREREHEPPVVTTSIQTDYKTTTQFQTTTVNAPPSQPTSSPPSPPNRNVSCMYIWQCYSFHIV